MMDLMTLKHRHRASIVMLAAMLPLTLVACTTEEFATPTHDETTAPDVEQTSGPDPNWADAPSQQDLTDLEQTARRALADSGREFYGSVGGLDDGDAAIDLALDRDGLAIVGVCAGGAGTATVRVDNDEVVDLPCGDDIMIHDLIDSLDLQGRRLRLTVADLPHGALWSVIATNTA